MSFFAEGDGRAAERNDRAGERASRPTRRRGAALVLPALLGLGLLAAGCGGSTPHPSVANLGPTTSGTTSAGASSAAAASGGSSPQTSGGGASAGGSALVGGGGVAQMSKYSGCMRRNGEPSFPDPNSQGQISFSSASGVDPGSPEFQHAQQACQKLLPNGGQPSPAQQAQARTMALAMSACMRSHGVPNFPDPQFGPGGRVTLKISVGGGLDPRSSQFQAAQTACQKDRLGPPGTASVGAVGPKASNGG